MNERFHIEVDLAEGGAWVALCEELPEMIGHGDDSDEAVADIVAQIFARVLH